jgi:hypothetical protein
MYICLRPLHLPFALAHRGLTLHLCTNVQLNTLTKHSILSHETVLFIIFRNHRISSKLYLSLRFIAKEH